MARFVITSSQKIVMVAGMSCAGFFCGIAVSQDSGLAEIEPPATAAVMDEVIVRGRSPATFRMQIQLAEVAIYDRFNAINSDDEYDIHCKRIRLTGSKMLRRVCQPNFWHETEEDVARDALLWLQGGTAVGSGVFRGAQHYKRVLMREEMRQLAIEDAEFLEALLRLGDLQQAYKSYGKD